MPPKAKKVKQQKTSATAATKGASKNPTTVDTSTLSIAERVALRNVDRQFRLESSSSSSSSSESDAQEPPRRGAKKKVPTKQTRPMAAAVATKKARAPSPKKLPPPPPAKAKKAPPKAPTAATVKKAPPPKKGKGSRASSTAPPSAKPSPQRGNKRSTTVTSRSSSLPRSSPPHLSQETDPVVPIIALVSSSTSSHRNHHEEEGQERDASSLLPSASPHRNEEDEVRLPMSLLTPEKVVGEEDDAGVLSLFSPGAVGATSSSNSDDDDDVGVRPHETTTVPIVRERGAGGEPSPLQVVREHSSGRGMSITARPSAMLIAKAAATKPQQSPQTMWISLSSDDDDDPDNDVMEVVDGRDRRHSSQSPDPTVLGGGGGSAAASGPSHSPSPPDARNGRTPLPGGGAGSPPGLRFATPSTSSLPAPLVPALLATNTQATQLLLSPLPSSVTMRDVLPPTFRARKAHEGRVKHPPPPGAKVIDVMRKTQGELSSDDDDDPDDDVMEVIDGRDRRHSSQSPDPTVLGGGGGSAAASGPSHSPSPPDARNGRTPLPGGGAGSPPGLRFATPSTSSLPAPLVPALLATNTQATQLLLSPLPSSVTMRDVLPPTFRARKAHEGRVKHPPPPGAKVIDVDEEDARGGGELTQRMENNGQQWVPGRLAHPLHRPGATAAVAATVPRWITPQQQPMALPTRRVPLKRDRPLDSQAPDDSDVMPPPAPRPTSTAAGQHPGQPNPHHHRGNSTTTQQVMSSSPTSTYFTPNKYAEGRPVDVLKPLFPKTFTKEGFLDMAAKVVTKSHCLPSSEFWEAFTDVAYLGEGSFGLVWRCKTLDGDVVAVKSCPLSFHSPEAIDDGFSVLREVAVMRFLNEQHVPYVLPLHNAFFVNGTEALPPHVSEVVCLHSKVETEVTRRKKRRLRKNPNMTQEEFERATSTVYDVVAKYILSEEEYAHLTTVKRPKFFAISELDALECEATMFLVVELCDGDVEEVQRSDAVSRGVAYCVSSALAAMHRLGLVHLDLKPSNILYACERSGAGGDGASSGVTAMKFYLSDFGNCHIVGSAYKDGGSTQRCRVQGCGVLRELSAGCHAQTWACTLRFEALEYIVRVRSGAGGDGASSGVTAMKFYLSDFGNCHIVGSAYKDEIRDAVGTYEYMDTQALEEKRCSRATDCFSLGCTLYELLMFARLYQPSCKCEEHSRHCFLPQSQGPFLISSTTVLHKVTELLLATDRSKRLTAAGCLTYLVNALGITSHHAAARAPTGGAARDLFAESSPSASSSELKVSSSTKRRITASMNDDSTTDPSSYHNPLLDEEHHHENGIEALPMSPSQRSLALASTPQRVRFSSTPTAFRGSPHHQ
ncbi:Hypothetical protein, putative [Bodo saltans]|uniref:Protein kinase domain-containing protein n=1 Tax=Bodo saltans TaxID=75058 RepID=A0A0S4JI25_BODSA|nr:Hypothetical protein, putative [Bodo saltans]|eukprot:CUG91166.1 Hypothetical protein, putative [Bodo saltans]